ncbi:MAG: LON peptidase substrate-binding domain-containing protein [Gammaproteobacteria bacterium]|nr:LON peptidase substrate-binding domain-containing protein [Gammaproteobacteria bacterium]
MAPQLELPLFPLGVVLFKNGLLPLHIFEPRYVNMIENVIEMETGFGVVLLRDGSDVYQEGESSPPPIYCAGTIASIRQYKRLPDGRFYVLVEGGAKFHVESSWELDNHLRMALVRIEKDEAKFEMRESDADLVDVARKAVDAAGVKSDQVLLDYSDATSVSMRLSEYLPLDLHFRQQLFELNNAHRRLDLIRKWLNKFSKETL